MTVINSAYNRQFNNPAKYRNSILFQELKTTQSNEGHKVTDWIDSDLGTTFAQIRNIRGNEFIMAGANQVKVSARINMRYRKDVVEKDFELGEKLRLKFGSRVFEIVYINNLEERNVELEILVNEVR